jgi:hypothetical protein
VVRAYTGGRGCKVFECVIFEIWRAIVIGNVGFLADFSRQNARVSRAFADLRVGQNSSDQSVGTKQNFPCNRIKWRYLQRAKRLSKSWIVYFLVTLTMPWACML